MKKLSWQVRLGLLLVAVSAVLYSFHYLIFEDAHHIFIYLVGDIAFLPLEVFLVAIIMHGLLSRHEKTAMLQKMNMVIGAFFSEVGSQLIVQISQFDLKAGELQESLNVNLEWTKKDYKQAANLVKSHDSGIAADSADIKALSDFLSSKRSDILRLLENQNLLEHATFTDLLWAVNHLADELSARDTLDDLPLTDIAHLSGDIRRVHSVLLLQWLKYLEHLQTDYPYLFSLAVRTNPFNKKATPVISK